MLHPDREVTSIPQLLQFLNQDTADIQGQLLWFRGLKRKSYTLIPSIYRKNIKANIKEMDLVKLFKQDSIFILNQLNQKPANPVEWLFIMRHYQVPTRLLDWTESPLIGAYFAAEDEKYDGALWVLRPLELNKEIPGQVEKMGVTLPSFDENKLLMDNYVPGDIFDDQVIEMNPIAFIYPRNIARMQEQLSVYTIHHKNKISIDKLGKRLHIWRYIITKECKISIKKELLLLGLDKYKIFPELESIGEKVKGIAIK